MRVKYWYSEKQKNVVQSNPEFTELLRMFEQIHGLEPEPETRCFVTLPVDGEMVEVEYTECYGGDDPNYQSNWEDAVFIGESDGYAPIRVVEVTA